MKSINTAVVVSLFGMLAACGGADQPTVPQAQGAGVTFIDTGDHVIHFNAQSTDHLPPEVAQAYNIVRSKNRAMVNVSIIDSSTNKSVTAEIAVKCKNLAGQLKNVVMRKIQEQDAIYYVGETAVTNRETLIFHINVTPDGADEPSELRFQRDFYSD